MFKLVWTASFVRAARKFMKKHPDLNARFAATLRQLERDPFAPSLALHPLGGKLKGIQAVSITGSYRIALTVLIGDGEIILLDVGSHDEVYKS